MGRWKQVPGKSIRRPPDDDRRKAPHQTQLAAGENNRCARTGRCSRTPPTNRKVADSQDRHTKIVDCFTTGVGVGPTAAPCVRHSTSYVKRVLVVESNPAIGRMLTLILQKDGIRIVVVTSGTEAIEHLRKHQVDLVFSELRIGGRMDGQELCVHVRRESANARFVFGTRVADLEHAKFSNAVEVLAKPYRLTDLRRMLGAIKSPRRVGKSRGQLSQTIRPSRATARALALPNSRAVEYVTDGRLELMHDAVS
jgi:CheY-like chemotaxis protein